MFKTAFNTTDTPVPAGRFGQLIGGNEWGTVETTDDVARAGLENGGLMLIDTPKASASVDDQASAAFDRTKTLRERGGKLDALDRDTLYELAVDAGMYDDGDEQPYKADLVERLAASDVDVPDKKTAATKTADKIEES